MTQNKDYGDDLLNWLFNNHKEGVTYHGFCNKPIDECKCFEKEDIKV